MRTFIFKKKKEMVMTLPDLQAKSQNEVAGAQYGGYQASQILQ